VRQYDSQNLKLRIYLQDIDGVLNIQHDCHKSQCQVHRERAVIVEQRVSKHKEPVVIHTENPSFILNSAAFYSTKLHREWAQITFGGVTEAGWRSAVETGIKNW
ncbi:hypothetical protein DFH28DRAFT_875657, partial [Melampsora americana]